MIATLPSPKDVKDLYGDLLGKEISVQVSDSWFPGSDEAYAADFVDDAGATCCAALLDLPLAVRTGAALGLLTAGSAQEMIDKKAPEESVLANLYEVLNVLTAVFNTPANSHIRIAALCRPGLVPAAIAAAASQPVNRLDLTVDIAGYGGGRLALVTV